jgi:hypothetical protein
MANSKQSEFSRHGGNRGKGSGKRQAWQTPQQRDVIGIEIGRKRPSMSGREVRQSGTAGVVGLAIQTV